MSQSLLTDAFDHHVWASIRLLDACSQLTAEQLETTVPGTYGSILDTLRHLVGADASYLAALTRGRRAMIEEDVAGVPQLRAEMEANRPEWGTLLAGDLDPDEIVVRHRPDGTESHAPLGVRLAQAIAGPCSTPLGGVIRMKLRLRRPLLR